MKRYILCRPKGGWNDTLCQIAKSYIYAITFNRELIVDTVWASGIKDYFDHYFSLNAKNPPLVPVHLRLSADLEHALSGMEFYSNEGVITNHSAPLWRSSRGNFTFDFSIDYPSQLLIHSSDGGGLGSIEILKILRLSKLLVYEIQNGLNALGENFESIMIRNTDYRTDFKKYYEAINENLDPDAILLVAADDRGCIDYAAKYFKGRSFSFSCPPAENTGEALIYGRHGSRLQTLYNYIALKELFICASAKRFHLTRLSGYKDQIWDGKTSSGFVNLANYLFSNSDIRKSVMIID